MISNEGLELIHPRHYAEHGYPHEAWTTLRREAPLAYFEPLGDDGFWAVRKHADVCDVSRQPDKFLNAPRFTIVRRALEDANGMRGQMRTLVNMDPPDHRTYRKLATPWFKARNLRLVEERMVDSGGLLALIERPDQLEKLRRDPSLMSTATGEIIRWTTPVNHFNRTANCDYELRGQKIRKDDSLCLFYASANRDEEVFDDPFAFRVDRDPNPHLAFGIGEHFCLGASLARMEIRVLLEELVPRLESIELAGSPERLASSFVGGVKHLPIRYRMRRGPR